MVKKRHATLDHTLTEPSSPAVAMAEPSKLHFKDITAPRCASTLFSSRPVSPRMRKLPSEQPTANVLSPPLLLGMKAIVVPYASKSHNFPTGVPSTVHFQMALSSL